jgi:large subunit ribosomal protein L35
VSASPGALRQTDQAAFRGGFSISGWRGAFVSTSRIQEEWSSKMPKMKTKSSAKKRFKITASGKVVAAAAGKRHGMIKRTNKFIRDARGTMVLAEPDGKKVIKNYLPNGL